MWTIARWQDCFPWFLLQARLVFEGLQLKAFVLASRPERLAALQTDTGDAMELTPEAWLQVRQPPEALPKSPVDISHCPAG